jgi:hypothetical protein
LPNILFAIFFLSGVKDILGKNERQNIYFKASVSLLILGAVSIFFSIFLDGGLNNLLIRLLNYWTIFASPIVLRGLDNLRSKRIKFIVIPILVFLAIINASRHPLIFNFR